MDKAYFYLPGAFKFIELYDKVLDLYKTKPNMFFDFVEIKGLYGAPGEAIWNSGRHLPGYKNTYEKVNFIMQKHPEVGLSLTFSNQVLEKRHLNDSYCNKLLQVFDRPGNGCVVNSNMLESYIRKNYPNYDIVSSTTKCIVDVDKLKKELERPYTRVVLDYNFNNNFEVLETLDHKDKCEFLVNAICKPDCPRRRKHYELISKYALYGTSFSLDCPYQHAKYSEAPNSPLYIGIDSIRDKYMPMGYHHFKLDGRQGSKEDIVNMLLWYLVRPSYYDTFRTLLL